jgi:hypothetical protein
MTLKKILFCLSNCIICCFQKLFKKTFFNKKNKSDIIATDQYIINDDNPYYDIKNDLLLIIV